MGKFAHVIQMWIEKGDNTIAIREAAGWGEIELLRQLLSEGVPVDLATMATMRNFSRSLNSLHSLLFLLLVACTAPAQAFDLPERPDPSCEKLCTGEWWKKKSNPIINLHVDRSEVIAFALYTHDRGVLKLTAQLFPLYPTESLEVRLQLKRDGAWTDAAKQAINPQGWNTTFRIEDWDNSVDVPYRLLHGEEARYEGLIRRDPADKEIITLAALSCDSPKGKSSREPYIHNINHQDPDLVFFAGDQSYYHTEHTAGWLTWGMKYREIFRNRPCVTIPDDHDIGQANLWGESGKVSEVKDSSDGGYNYSPEYVRMVERTQTAHLPDPYDPTPIKQGIGVYYTTLLVGGVDFAILEDRKFKSGPKGKIPQQGPRPDHIRNPEYDPASIDLPGLVLLGERQLNFLDNWATSDRGQMKAALSQTGFCGATHIHGQKENRLHADLDSNGWPQAGRLKAVQKLKEAKAVHIAGDQHLATLLQHGINEFRDGPWAFCVPASINTYYGRWWWPEDEQPGQNPDAENPLPWNGDYFDGFHNRVTMHAYANPESMSRGEGYGLIKFNKAKHEVTFECWPRESDVTSPDAKQFHGWPKTVSVK